MSVSMIENWSVIHGLVQAIVESHDLDGFDQVEVLVESVTPVEGFPDLVSVYLEEEPEPRLPVLMPVELIDRYEIVVGVVVECRVRRAGRDRVFVHRDYVVVHRPSK